jgi:hypothetical protein
MLVSRMGCSGRGGRGHFVYGGVPSVTRTVAGEGVAVEVRLIRGDCRRDSERIKIQMQSTVVLEDPEV